MKLSNSINLVNYLIKNTVGENPTADLQNQVIRQTNEILDKQEFILEYKREKFNKESLKDRVGELIEKKDFIGLKSIILNIEKNDIQVGYYNYFHSILSEIFEEKVSNFKMNSMYGKIGKLLCFMYENGFIISDYLNEEFLEKIILASDIKTIEILLGVIKYIEKKEESKQREKYNVNIDFKQISGKKKESYIKYYNRDLKSFYELCEISDKNNLGILIIQEDYNNLANRIEVEDLNYFIKIGKKFNLDYIDNLNKFIINYLKTCSNYVFDNQKFNIFIEIIKRNGCEINFSSIQSYINTKGFDLIYLIKNNLLYISEENFNNIDLKVFSIKEILTLGKNNVKFQEKITNFIINNKSYNHSDIISMGDYLNSSIIFEQKSIKNFKDSYLFSMYFTSISRIEESYYKFENEAYFFKSYNNIFIGLGLKLNLTEFFNEKINDKNNRHIDSYLLEAKRLNLKLDIDKNIILSFVLNNDYYNIAVVLKNLFSIGILKAGDDFTSELINKIFERFFPYSSDSLEDIILALQSIGFNIRSISFFDNNENVEKLFSILKTCIIKNLLSKSLLIFIRLIKVFNLNIPDEYIKIFDNEISYKDLIIIVEILGEKSLLDYKLLKVSIGKYNNYGIDKFKVYIELFNQLNNSPSQEIQRLNSEISDLLISYDYDEAKENLDNIISICLKVGSCIKTFEMLKKFLAKVNEINDENLIESYLSIFNRLNNSPSQEIQRLKSEISDLLINYSYVEANEILNQIEDIFIRNHLPNFGKVFKVFEFIHDKSSLKQKISNNQVSPFLYSKQKLLNKKLGENSIKNIFYSDLLKSFAYSNNRDLKEYVSLLKSGEILLRKYENNEEFNEKEQKQFHNFLIQLSILYNSKDKIESIKYEGLKIEELYELLKANLGLKNGESIETKLSNDFLKPLKVNSFDELLNEIELKVKQVNERGIEFSRHYLTLEEGDFLKGINESYFSNILQNGSNAKEFLGASSDSDSTPLDTDMAKVLPGQGNNTKEILQKSMSNGYGSIKFIFKKDSFGKKCTNTTSGERYDDFGKYEVFKTGSEEHYGVRTGIASSDIDSLVFEDLILSDEKKKQEYFINIVQNGFYIPVYNNNGELIFSYDDFNKYKKIFDGIEKFEGNDFELKNTDLSQIKDDKYQDIGNKINQNIEEMQKYMNIKNSEIENIILSVLKEKDIEVKEKGDRGIVGAEIVNCGSTGRGTSMLNLPGKEELFATDSLDIDVTVHLDQIDISKIQEVIKEIHEKLETTDDNGSGSRENGSFQLKSNDNKFGFRIDILFVTKNQLREYDTATALEDRYENIEKKYGKDKINEIKTQVILAKKILKDNGIYKKQDGGLSGVGVENWILSNGGSLVEAFRTFIETSEKVGNDFEEFKKSYSIIDPGMNVKFDSFDNEKISGNSRDNYVYKLSKEAYMKFLKIGKKIK